MDQATLRKVTTELEHEQTADLQPLLQGTFLEDRIATLTAIQKMNQSDQKSNPNVPDLQFDVSTSFAGTDTLSLSLDHHNAHDAWVGGPTLYSDTLDLKGLSHSTAGDYVPKNNTQIDVRALTTKLENGDGTGVSKLLSGLHEEERVRVFEGVAKLNSEDLAHNKTNATLEIDISPDKIGDNYINVTRSLPGAHDSFFGGTAIYNDNLQLQNGQRTVSESNDTRK